MPGLSSRPTSPALPPNSLTGAAEMDQNTKKRVTDLLAGTLEDCLKGLELLANHPGEDSTVTTLVACLAHPRWKVRKRAAEVLGNIGEMAMPSLIEAMESSNEDRSFWAIRILGGLGEAAIPHLVRAYKRSQDKDRRYFSVSAMGSTRTAAAVPALIDALGDSSWSIRREASDQLVNHGREALPFLQKASASGDPNLRYWSIKTLARILGKDAMESLSSMVEAKDSKARYYAVLALGEIREDDAVNLLVTRLGDSSWMVRKLAADHLERFGRMAVPKLVKAFETGSPDVKYWSIQLIGRILKGKAVHSLEKILADTDENLRSYAILALGETRSEKAIPLLISSFTDPSWLVREQAADVLLKMGRKTLGHLEKFLNSPNEDIRFWSVRVLSRLSDQGARILSNSLPWLDARTRLFVIDNLVENNLESSTQALMQSLSDNHWPVRRKAAEGLVTTGPRVIPAVLDLLTSEDPDVRYWAGKVMDSFSDETADYLMRTFAKGEVDKSERLIGRFQEVTSPMLVESLIRRSSSAGEESRYYVSRLLGRALGPGLDKLIEMAYKARGISLITIIESLGKISLPHALRTLMSLETGDPAACLAITRAVASRSENSAINFLVRKLETGNDAERQAAADALVQSRPHKFLTKMKDMAGKSADPATGFWLAMVFSAFIREEPQKYSRWIAAEAQELAGIACQAALQTGHDGARDFFSHAIQNWSDAMVAEALESLRGIEPSWFPDLARRLVGTRSGQLDSLVVSVIDGYSNKSSVAETLSSVSPMPDVLRVWIESVNLSREPRSGGTLSSARKILAGVDGRAIKDGTAQYTPEDLTEMPDHQFVATIAGMLRAKPGPIASVARDFGKRAVAFAAVEILQRGEKLGVEKFESELRKTVMKYTE